jgi:hypothetical protein
MQRNIKPSSAPSLFWLLPLELRPPTATVATPQGTLIVMTWGVARAIFCVGAVHGSGLSAVSCCGWGL